MSMKSFDKLCRDILIGDPYAEREIFDERQKLFRLKLSVEALLIFGGLLRQTVSLWNSSANGVKRRYSLYFL